MRIHSVLHPTHRTLIALTMTTCSLLADAQSKSVIIDKETRTPIRNVKVTTDNGQVAVSDYQGRVALDSAFRSASITHVSYLMRTIDQHEWRDTLWLLPNTNRIGEVVVWGKARKNILDMTTLATSKAAAQATPPPGGISFDFFEMMRKKPLNKKARRKNKELLSNWDRLYENKTLSTPKAKKDDK